MTLKRFTKVVPGGMKESSDGKWVRYDDVQAKIKELKKQFRSAPYLKGAHRWIEETIDECFGGEKDE